MCLIKQESQKSCHSGLSGCPGRGSSSDTLLPVTETGPCRLLPSRGSAILGSLIRPRSLRNPHSPIKLAGAYKEREGSSHRPRESQCRNGLRGQQGHGVRHRHHTQLLTEPVSGACRRPGMGTFPRYMSTAQTWEDDYLLAPKMPTPRTPTLMSTSTGQALVTDPSQQQGSMTPPPGDTWRGGLCS